MHLVTALVFSKSVFEKDLHLPNQRTSEKKWCTFIVARVVWRCRVMDQIGSEALIEGGVHVHLFGQNRVDAMWP